MYFCEQMRKILLGIFGRGTFENAEYIGDILISFFYALEMIHE